MATAALLAAVGVWLLATLPPTPLEIPLEAVDPTLLRRTTGGAYHVHTTRSDGAGDRAAVAAAAARAGLGFVIFTEHGDGTRPPAPPEYLSGVLCLDGVEISTNGGHYVALDMPAAPYPLGGDAAAVVEDVARLGGFGIAAHPDHPRPEIAWSDWSAPMDGLEWINLDSAWRDDGPLALARVLFDYVLRPVGAIGSLLDRPVAMLNRWDALARTRPVVALAAVDAHGSGRRQGEGRAARMGIGPAYEASFRTLSNRVLLERPFTGDAAPDARLLLDAIRRGHVYSVVDAIARGVVLGIRQSDGAFELASPLPAGGRPVLVTSDRRRRLEVHVARAPGRPPVPWILSNWTGERPMPPVPDLPGAPTTAPLALASPWRVEKDARSSGQVAVSAETATLHYVLGEGRHSQFVAAAADLAGQWPFGALVFEGRAARAMRVSVQLRFPDGARWVKSVHLGPEERTVVVPVGQMVPAEQRVGKDTGSKRPSAGAATAVLIVVDLVNAAPGSSGSFSVRGLRIVQ